NEKLFNLDYVHFRSSLRGNADAADLQSVPWASMASEVNTAGELLAPGYAFDLATRGAAALTFTAATYPALAELLNPDASFEELREAIYAAYPQYLGLLDAGPEGLENINPGLFNAYEAVRQGNDPLEGIEDGDIAFKFHITASATVLTRDEFIAQQTAEAQKLRQAILADTTASTALVLLAADETAWSQLYLAALEEAGLLRPDDQAPAVRET